MSDVLGLIEAHQGLAAWVQAVGAIAAIVWAGIIARRGIAAQGVLQRRAERRSMLARLDGFIALAEVALEEVGVALKASSRDDHAVRYATEVFENRTFLGLIDALAAFPIHEMGEPKCIAGGQRFRDGLTHASLAANNFVAVVRAKKFVARGRPIDALEEPYRYMEAQLNGLRRCRGGG